MSVTGISLRTVLGHFGTVVLPHSGNSIPLYMDNNQSSPIADKKEGNSEAGKEKRARATVPQMHERITLVSHLLIKGLNASEIKNECKKRFGVKGRLVEVY